MMSMKRKWRPVQNKAKKVELRSRQERSRGDAIMVEVRGGPTYAHLLQKADPELKELVHNVVKIRRTQKGEMLFEPKKDPTVKRRSSKGLAVRKRM